MRVRLCCLRLCACVHAKGGARGVDGKHIPPEPPAMLVPHALSTAGGTTQPSMLGPHIQPHAVVKAIRIKPGL